MLAQIAIFIFGASAIYLVGRTDKWQRWGYIMGALGQPFWLYVTITTEQWGILAMTVVYTYSWGNGIYNHWIRKTKTEPWHSTTEVNELSDEIKNAKKVIEVMDTYNCWPCRDSGIKSTDFAYEYEPCHCQGENKTITIRIPAEHGLSDAILKSYDSDCSKCKGTGKISENFLCECITSRISNINHEPPITVLDHVNKIKD